MTEATFNAVIEGIYETEAERTGFKLAHLEVPENAAHFFDSAYEFIEYDLGKQQEMRRSSKLENVVIVESLTLCKGLIVPWMQGGIKSILKKPRMVCLDDERIFVERDILAKEKHYLQKIEGLTKGMRYIFRESSFQRLYAQAMWELVEAQTP